MQPDTIVLFLHLPKCGGTTLSNIIYNEVCIDRYAKDDPRHKKGERDLFNPHNYMFHAGVYYFQGQDAYAGFLKGPEPAFTDPVKHALRRPALRAVVGHYWFGIHQHVTRPWTYLTLLRDPLERVASLFWHLKAHEGVEQSFDDFLAAPSYREVDNDQTRRISGQEPPLGQCTRAMLETAKDNLRRYFSMVGVADRFDETVILLKRRLGWERDVLYRPMNITPDRPPASSLPARTQEGILRWNELDRELYEFAAGLLDEMVSAQDHSFHDEVFDLVARKRALLEEVSRTEEG
jgi:hypothetical protein